METPFIVFEGIEGSGKTTQIALLADTLRRQGRAVCATREPGGTAFGERIRVLLLEPADAVSPRAEALLMTAGRAQHVRDVIHPALERGEVVLCDRFTDSTLAYQGAGRGLPLDELRGLQVFATMGLEPGLRILLDLPVEAGLARRRGEPESLNRIDAETVEFHQRVRACYLELATANPAEWAVIDADRAPGAVNQEVLSVVTSHLAISSRGRIPTMVQG